MSRSSINTKRLSGLTWVGLSMFAVAGLSQARVQLVQRDDILDRATKTDRFVITRTEAAKRGGIVDREGRPLAEDEDTRYLTVQFSKTPKSPAFYLDLAAATGIPATEFATLAETASAPVDWQKPLGAAQVNAVNDVKQRWRADGVGLSRPGRRSYPLGEAGAGFVGAMRGKLPLSGVELGFNRTLSGTNGKMVGIVDREGNYLPMRLDKQTVRRTDGQTLTLSIDSELQQAAAEAVKQAVDANKADQGVAIVMDPKTGDVLAMANWPSFDPNKAIEKVNGRTPEFNGAYMSALEPGSTFKVLTLAKALDKGVVEPQDTYYCKGSIQIRNRVISCDRKHGIHGLVDCTTAIARSCNLAAADWARRIGHDDFVKYMEQMGLMEKPGLGLPQESRGLYNYNDYTKDVQLATNGFGQSMNYTPLALCSAFCMLGNDGKRVHPRLVLKTGDRTEPVLAGEEIVRPETAHKVLDMMKAVLDSDRGTGKSLRIPGYEIGGKTGTAQKKNFTTGEMKGGGYVSNFVGFVPADQPRAVVLVMIDNPKAGQIYGALVAGPVFKSIAQNVIRRMHIPKSTSVAANLPIEPEKAIAAPAPFVQETSRDPIPDKKQPETKKRVEPKIEVKSKVITRSAEPTQVTAPRTSKPRTVRKVEESVETNGRAPAVIKVPNPARTAKATTNATPRTTRSIRPQLDELRKLGKESEKRTVTIRKPAAATASRTTKPKVTQSQPRRTATQSQVKRSRPDRVNR